jgi:hypothetical protein
MKSSSGKFSHCVEEALFVVWEGSRVDSANVATEPVDYVLVELIGFLIFKLDDFAVPSFLLDFLADGDGVFAVAIWSFIAAPDGLDDADGSSFFNVGVCYAGSH